MKRASKAQGPSCRRILAKSATAAGSAATGPAATGRLSDSLALPGMQMSAQTSQDASPASTAAALGEIPRSDDRHEQIGRSAYVIADAALDKVARHRPADAGLPKSPVGGAIQSPSATRNRQDCANIYASPA